jgi:hypothetical protein
MDRYHGMQRLILVSWLAAFSLPGCAHFDLTDPTYLWPFGREARTDQVPGLATPAERIAVLRNLAEEAPRMGRDEQEQTSRELAGSMREEADPSIRAEIVRTLGALATDTAAATLRSALNDTEADVRIAACRAWGRRGGQEAARVLSGVVTGDIDIDVRLAAAEALGRTRDPQAQAALGAALAESDPAMQRRAMLSLHEVTGKDFGGDAQRWQQYLRGENPEEDKSLWVAKRLEELWGRFY